MTARVQSILAGLLLGDLVPGQLLSKSWRVPVAAMVIAIGIILAISVSSREV